MLDVEHLCGDDILKVLDETRSPVERAGIRNKALQYLRESAGRLPENEARSCRDLVENFDTHKNISDQLRDLAVWVDEVNVRMAQA